jgi:hypothetical protein
MIDPAARHSAFGDTFDNVPTAMVYDTFTEAATALRSRYTRLSDDATTSHGTPGGQRSWSCAMPSTPYPPATGPH